MDPRSAQRVIESLRQGIPPEGFVCDFTTGRRQEIERLTARLSEPKPGAVLLKANYGSGKTHLLRFIREKALAQGFVVSSVTLDAKSAVRFNRMDQILGAIFRGLEVDDSGGAKGIRSLFNLLASRFNNASSTNHGAFWKTLASEGKWDFSNSLASSALYVALRAWVHGDNTTKDLIQDWLYQPWNYKSQRKCLYLGLVEGLRRQFRDPRPDWQFYADEVFSLHAQGYSQCWAILRDLQVLTVAAGLKGLIVLFDEFEDILNNIDRINHQQAAFWNLFQFYGGKSFDGISFFAVTPEFVHKCKARLQSKGFWDYDYSQFEAIPTFQMTPLRAEDLEELAMKIMETHGLAYSWEPDLVMRHSQLRSIIRQTASRAIEDRGRITIRTVVNALDALFNEQE